MIEIDVRFVTGKFHATPWGKAPNEGVPEWPPSPYRLLRAIIASWKYNHHDIEDGDVGGIVAKLASEKPTFYLPPATIAHTRHYMPPKNYQFPYKPKTNLILDTFLVVAKTRPVCIQWNGVSFADKEKNIVGKILSTLPYMGRSESWCVARLNDRVQQKPNCVPLGSTFQGNVDLVRVMLPEEGIDLKSLYTTTDNIRKKEKKVYPDGSRIEIYQREQECLAPRAMPKTFSDNVQIVRYAIANTVKPSVTNTLRIAEDVRSAAMAQYGFINKGAKSKFLSGKDESGLKLSGHVHAFYVPTDDDCDEHIDHITILTKNAIPEKELDALFHIKDVWNRRNPETRWHLIVESYGMIENFKNTLPMFRDAKRWCSATPFVPTRHTKYSASTNKPVKDSPEEQIVNEISRMYKSEAKVTMHNKRSHVKNTRFIPAQFNTVRRGRNSGGGAYNITVEFARPVSGPIILGYGNHFGLGLLVPDGG